MKKEAVILIVEDDEGHTSLIIKNLKRAGILNEMICFKDGQEILDFLFTKKEEHKDMSFLILLDIRMPKVDGLEVLKKIKTDVFLKRIPVIIITTTDEPVEVEGCHELGCNNYIKKPIDYNKFVETIKRLGLFLMVIEIPTITSIQY